MVRKLSRQCGILTKLRHFLPRRTLITYYKQYVQPAIQYGCLVYCGTTESKLYPIFVQQKKILRVIYFKRRSHTSRELFIRSGVTSVYEIYLNELLKFVANCLRNEHPSAYLNDIVTGHHQNFYQTRFSVRNYGQLPHCRSEMLRRSVKYRGIRLLNKLQEINLLPNFGALSQSECRTVLYKIRHNFIIGSSDLIRHVFHT